MKWFGKVQVPFLRAGFEAEVARNRAWYTGEVGGLAHFYSLVDDGVGNTSFWAQGGRNPGIRKVHSGLPALMVDTLADIVSADMLGINIDDERGSRIWNRIFAENDFPKLMKNAIKSVLGLGDGQMYC